MTLTRRWVKPSTVLFAVGAVSGTILSFELGLLWPTFTEYSGSVIGLSFTLEGFALFLEAIFLGQHSGSSTSDAIAVFLKVAGCFGLLAFLAIALGWMVTELERQPQVIYGVLSTKDAVTTATGLDVSFLVFSLIYVLLAITASLLTSDFYSFQDNQAVFS